MRISKYQINEAIKALRMKAGLTRLDLAFELGVSERTIVRWELGETIPSLDYVFRMGQLAHEAISLDIAF